MLSLGLAALAAFTGSAVPLIAADASAASATPSTVTAPDQRITPLVELVALAIAGGFPDAKGATLHRGTIGVIHRYDATNTRTDQVDGVHAKLVDGRWLVGLQNVKPAADVDLTGANLKPLEIAALVAALGAESQPAMDAQVIDQWLQSVPAADRERLRPAMPAMPVATTLQCSGHASELAIAHLIRLEAPCAYDVATLMGIYDRGDASYVNETTRLTLIQHEARMGCWFFDQSEIPVPDPIIALRRGLFRYFREFALDKNRVTPADAADATAGPAPAAALVTAARLLTPDEAAAQADLALLRGRLALPATVAADAALADRLALWNSGLASNASDGFDIFDDQDTYRPNGPVGESPPLAISEADLDALIALLDDPRPCRWLDADRARTLGDNALRAISLLVNCDPRRFIGRDVAAPWTSEERAATAAAMRTWRASHQGKPLADILAAAVPMMRSSDLARVLSGLQPDRRAPVLAAAAKAWAAGPPKDVDHEAIDAVIVFAGHDAELLAAVASWPVEGELASFLAGFHLTNGNSKPLDDLLVSVLTPSDEAAEQLDDVLALVCHAPTPSQAQRVSEALRLPLAGMPTKRLVETFATGFNSYRDGLVEAWATRQAKGDLDLVERRRQILPLALYALLLVDDRPLTPRLRQLVQASQQRAEPMKMEKVEPAADLRVADFAGANFESIGWEMAEVLGDTLSQRRRELAVDLSQPIAERNRQLTTLRRDIAEVLEPALEAAGLPNLAPGVAPAAGDDKALF